jgi:thiamine-monophosphate kinase
VFVTGTIGDATLGLKVLRGISVRLDTNTVDFLLDRYRVPQPRTALGPRLIGHVSAMLDVSDGLLADLGHICDVSGVGAVIEADRVPLSPAAHEALAADATLIDTILGGGDDYELLFAAPLSSRREFDRLAAELALPITEIGRIELGKGVRVVDAKGHERAVARRGGLHF